MNKKAEKFIFVTTPERSRIMGKIKGKDTTPELLLRKKLWHLGIRYRKNAANLPGKPDIVIHKKKVAIFVDGEFWHGYNWHIKKQKIKANKEYWVQKIERNMQRDVQNNSDLEELGFTVVRFWEQEIKKDVEACIKIILSYL